MQVGTVAVHPASVYPVLPRPEPAALGDTNNNQGSARNSQAMRLSPEGITNHKRLWKMVVARVKHLENLPKVSLHYYPKGASV